MKFYGQFSPHVDQVIYERYFPSKEGGISIECGAFDGLLENSTKFFEENFNWKTINIEPLPHIYKQLQSNRPESVNLEIALSDENTTKEITVYDLDKYGIYNTNASLDHLNKHKNLLEQISSTSQKINVECKTYETLIDELKLTDLDLFVLDVEGHEPSVIQGMKNCDILPKIFVIEHGHRTPEFISNELKCLKKEYKLDFISHVNSYFVRVD